MVKSMNIPALIAKAQKLQSLVTGPEILVLPNVWDAGSTRIVADAGFQVIATSSAGIAWSLGYADGEKIQRNDMLFMVQRISHTVDLPVTADMEAGYGENPEAVAETLLETLKAGAVGANFEDSLSKPKGRELLEFKLSVERIQAARVAANSVDVPFVINARTDGFYGSRNDDPFDEAVQRANAYLEAGADSVFVPFVHNKNLITRLVKEIDGPVNILIGPSSPTIPELKEIGVARASIGGLFSLMSYTNIRKACAEIHDGGTYSWAQNALTHPEINELMS